MSSDAMGSADDPQLPLFHHASARRRPRRGIPREVARASVGPGWWPVVAPLWDDSDEIWVLQCHEDAGVLRLSAIWSADPEDAAPPTELEADEPGVSNSALHCIDLEPTLDHLVRLCATTCACCGQCPATARDGTPNRPRQVLCDICHVQIGMGIPLLAVADQFWRLDGARRPIVLAPPPPAPPPPPHVPAGRAGTGLGSPGAQPVIPVPRDARPASAEFTSLPADELRSLVRTIRASISSEIVGQEEAVARLALFAALHVGGGLTHGQRALLIGRSGVGKTSIIRAMRRALSDAGWTLPQVSVDAIELTSPGWSGAPSMHELIAAAIGDIPYDSLRARKAIVVIDEIHHVGVAASADLTGNMSAKRREVLASLLALVGHGAMKIGPQHETWSAREALVLAVGSFEGLLDSSRPPTTNDLMKAGIPIELATRFHDVIALRPLGEGSLAALLRRWPAFEGLRLVCERLGFTVVVHPETITRAVRAVTAGSEGATPRTAGGWMVGALQDAMLRALDDPATATIEIAPDSLTIARAQRRPPPSDAIGADGGPEAGRTQ